MFNFLKKSKEEEVSFDFLLSKIKIIEAEIANLKATSAALETNIASLRNSVNRKGSKESEEGEKTTFTKAEVESLLKSYGLV